MPVAVAKGYGGPQRSRAVCIHTRLSRRQKVRGADTAPTQLEPSYRHVNKNRRPNAT